MKKYILIIGFAITLSLAFFYFDSDKITDTIKNVNSLSPVIFVFLYSLALVTIMPILPFTIAGIVVYGSFMGALYSTLACTLGLIVSYALSKSALGSIIYKRVKRYKLFKTLNKGVKRNLIKVLLVTRCVPIFSYGLQNYIYGILDVKFLPYFIISTISTLVMNFIYAASFNKALKAKSAEHTIIYIILFLGIIEIFKYFFKKSRYLNTL